MSKKHKVKIPEGYEFDSEEFNQYNGPVSDDESTKWAQTTVKFKPIQKKLPKTWDEYKYDTYCNLKTSTVSIVMPSKNMDAFVALSRLVQLRDHYNDGWEPDWESDDTKPAIQVWINKVRPINGLYEKKLLSFKTEKLRDEFLKNFRELIETAKPLL